MKFKIKEARERLGISQKELAKILGIKPTTFNGYETGTHDPKSEVLKQIAQVCGTSVDYLLGLTDVADEKRTLQAPVKLCGEKRTKDKLEYPTGEDILTARNTIIKAFVDVGERPKLSDVGERLSREAVEVAQAYEKASFKEKNTVRVTLDLPLITGEKASDKKRAY